jgi:hypothetical protein
MKVQVDQLAPNVYRVLVTADDGSVLARIVGPPAWALEQLDGFLFSPLV